MSDVYPISEHDAWNQMQSGNLRPAADLDVRQPGMHSTNRPAGNPSGSVNWPMSIGSKNYRLLR